MKIFFSLLISLSCFNVISGARAGAADVFHKSATKLLRWKFQKGDQLEIKKYSNQKITINGTPLNRLAIHRVLLDVKDLNESKGYFLTGSFASQFRMAKSAQRASFKSEEFHRSSFFLEPRGIFHVASRFLMPNVRNIPVFPEKFDPGSLKYKMKDGFEWKYPGLEIMRTGINISIPFDVNYTYRGAQTLETKEGIKRLHKIEVNYQINYVPQRVYNRKMPKKFFGFANSIILWDEKECIPYLATEDYNLIVLYNNGDSHEFQLKSKTRYRKIHRKRPRGIAQKLKKQLAKNSNAKGIKIKSGKHELKIILPDVLFDFDSDNLSDLSEDVLDSIIEVLIDYRSVHIRIEGHSDSTGNKAYNRELSERRAKRVTDYLLGTSKLKTENLSYRGLGASQPIANNSNKSGRKKNRRVEIILENAK